MDCCLFEFRDRGNDRVAADLVVARVDEEDATRVAVLFQVGQDPAADTRPVRGRADDGDGRRPEQGGETVLHSWPKTTGSAQNPRRSPCGVY